MLGLVPSVTIFQYALCNWRMIKFQVTVEENSLQLQQIEQGWTTGSLEEEKQTLRQMLVRTDFCICLPSWYGFSQWNLYLAYHLWHGFELNQKPILVYEGLAESNLIAENNLIEAEMNADGAIAVDMQIPVEHLTTTRQELIRQHRLTQQFAPYFRQASSVDPVQEYGNWVPDPNEPDDLKSIIVDAIKPELIKTFVYHALITEMQRLLKQKKYYGGLIDGDWGSRSQLALRRFQRLNDLSDRDMANGTKLYQLLTAETVNG